MSWVLVSFFSPSFCVFSSAQASTQPIEATLCELYQHPDQYAGKMVRVRGTIAGNDMWIDAFTEELCSSWMNIVVVFPNQVKPAPDFDLVKDDSFTTFEDAMYHSRPIHIEATFEGRFDSLVTVQDGKRTTAVEVVDTLTPRIYTRSFQTRGVPWSHVKLHCYSHLYFCCRSAFARRSTAPPSPSLV
jgi:hypothetical protein